MANLNRGGNEQSQVTVLGGTGFLGRRIVRHLLFGSRQGIQIGGTDCLVLMIRSFDP